MKILVHWNVLISLTLAPLVKTQLKSEFLPILLRVNAYQCCIPFCFSTEQNRTNRVDWVRLGSVIELNRTHKKVPVRLCSIAEPIELQSNDWVRLGSIGFWFGFVRLTTPACLGEESLLHVWCCSDEPRAVWRLCHARWPTGACNPVTA